MVGIESLQNMHHFRLVSIGEVLRMGTHNGRHREFAKYASFQAGFDWRGAPNGHSQWSASRVCKICIISGWFRLARCSEWALTMVGIESLQNMHHFRLVSIGEVLRMGTHNGRHREFAKYASFQAGFDWR